MKNTREYLVTVSAIVRVSDDEQLTDLHLCLMNEDTYGNESVTIQELGDDNHFEVLDYSDTITGEWLTRKLLGYYDEDGKFFVDGIDNERP